ncbi:MAG: hypothetical protein HY270_22160 [Deltaproteobacteria bacterium]|nr:hypothetical protein [Deltaproteobacteria bacterium]
MRRRALLALLLGLPACSQPISGVLTLAPAGMKYSDGCTANHDGTLEMPNGARAVQLAYMEGGAATLTATVRLVATDRPATADLYVEGDRVGHLDVTSKDDKSSAFQLVIAHSGPHAIRLEVHREDQEPGPLVHFEKLVLTQP